jgi:BirA family transcriptional regulator, biotin operon repressor / biotin---[acetyl-CoA-carboxylase] ligase
MQRMKIIHLEKVDSTQTYAKNHYTEFAPEAITCISADEQTAGRGRFQRKWIAPKGKNISATFYFQLPASIPHLTTLAQLMAYTLAGVIGIHSQIKWPNDILLSGKKLAGILCETIFDSSVVHCFLGVGINVNTTPEELAIIDQPATSLFIETQREWDRDTLLSELGKRWIEQL